MNRKEAEAAIQAAVPPGLARMAAVYIGRDTVAAGERLRIDRKDMVLEWGAFLGFIDLQAGQNWGHSCLYVFCNLVGHEMKTVSGQFPPEDHLLQPLVVGADVPSWAVIRG